VERRLESPHRHRAWRAPHLQDSPRSKCPDSNPCHEGGMSGRLFIKFIQSPHRLWRNKRTVGYQGLSSRLIIQRQSAA